MLFSESSQESWRERYGEEPGQPLPAIDRFLSHRSVRKFDSRPVDESIVAGLIAAAQSASTSSNLQLWSAISVQDPDRRKALAKLCADQKQVHEAPWFFAFLADHHRLSVAARELGIEPDGLDYMEFTIMAIVDAALAAERMVCAAEALGLGVCYIGALRNDPDGVKALLNLPEGTFGPFGLCLGYPAEEERGRIKPRFRQDAVWFRETYPADVPVDEYDARMAPHYAGRQLDTSWSKHSATRVDGDHMTGREGLLAFLQKQGFAKR